MLFSFLNTFLLIKNGTCVIQFSMNEFHLIKLNVLFLLSVNKDLIVAGMWRLGWGVGGEGWRWQRRVFASEEGLVESDVFCSLILFTGKYDLLLATKSGSY
jgi:hypothetical protein